MRQECLEDLATDWEESKAKSTNLSGGGGVVGAAVLGGCGVVEGGFGVELDGLVGVGY